MKTPKRKLKWIRGGAFVIDGGCRYDVLQICQPNKFNAVQQGHGGDVILAHNVTYHAAIRACERHARERKAK